MTPEDVRPIFGHDGKRERQRPVEIRDVAPGLWIWRLEHPHWKPGQGWDPIVACTCVESRGEVLVLDPLAPATNSTEVWQRLDSRPPTAIVVLKPDHVRDVDLFVRRYHARAFGSRLFFRHDIPETELEWADPGNRLPGGLVAHNRPPATPDYRLCVAGRSACYRDSIRSQEASHGAMQVAEWHAPARPGRLPGEREKTAAPKRSPRYSLSESVAIFGPSSHIHT